MLKEKKRILYFSNEFDNGGIKALCHDISKNINVQEYTINYFFVNSNGRRKEIESQFKQLGAEIHYKEDIKMNFIEKLLPKGVKQLIAVLKFLDKQPKYDAIHIHHCEGIPSILLASALKKIPIRITHSHVAYSEAYNPKKFPLKVKAYLYWRNLNIKLFSTHFWGCSIDACKAMFGVRHVEKGKTDVIFNGIDFNKFNPKSYNSEEIKKKYNLRSNNLNFLFVGRFVPQKNPIFLLEMINELVRIRKNIHLTIVGHGELEITMRATVERYNLSQHVTFRHHNSNIPELLSCMDYFVVPSLYEGLGIVFIEAQVMGVPSFASERVPQEAQLGMCEFPSLDEGVKGYAKYIDNFIERESPKKINREKLNEYNIMNTIKKLQKIYSLVK